MRREPRPSAVSARMIALAAVLMLTTACEATPAPTELTPTPPAANPVQVTIDLPAGWNDLIDEYRAEIPDTILSAVWSPGRNLHSGEPFATVSVGMYDPESNPRLEVIEDLDSWEQYLGDSVRGASGGLETLAGGAGRWGSISGTMDGQEKTIFSVHLFHGPYKLMALIETYDQDDAMAYELLEALQTVEFTGPVDLAGRAGRPLNEDGRWHSYCRTMSIPVQESWTYDFGPFYDREPWECPVDVDFLGAWATDLGGSEHVIAGYHYRNATLAEVQDSLSLPDVVGDSVVSPGGFTHTLVSEDAFVLANGTTGTRSQDLLESPSGEPDYGQLIGFDTAAGGCVVVFLFNTKSAFVDDIGSILEMLNALTLVDLG